VLLRSLQQRAVQPGERRPFGLAYGHYTHFHFADPRYPDLLIHRAISGLEKQRYKPGNWTELGATARRQSAAPTMRRAKSRLAQCYYMRDRVGEEFEGSGVRGD